MKNKIKLDQGTEIVPEFKINTNTVNDQMTPSVACNNE